MANGGIVFDPNWKYSVEFIALDPAPQVHLVGHIPLLWGIEDLHVDEEEERTQLK